MSDTLYNHNVLGNAAKPIIPNLVFKDACEAIKNGDTDQFYSVRSQYTLEETQLRLITKIYQEANAFKNRSNVTSK